METDNRSQPSPINTDNITASKIADVALGGIKFGTKAVSKFVLGFTGAMREGVKEAKEDLGLPIVKEPKPHQ